MRRRRLQLAGLVVALLAVVPLACSDDSGSSADAQTDGSTAVEAIGTYAVGEQIETFVDMSRPTAANGDFPGAPDRTLETVILYPATGTPGEFEEDAPPAVDDGPFPLVVFSHGAGSSGGANRDLTSRWVSAGYVVALPSHPLSSTDAPGGPIITDVTNQPADLSFVADEVIALGAGDGPLAGMIDGERRAVTGQSLGGITTFGAAYSACCADERFDAAIPMSGLTGIVEGSENYFAGPAIPLLILHGDEDDTVPYDSATSAFERAPAPKFLVTLVGAGHSDPFNGEDDPHSEAVYATSVAFLDHYLKDDPAGLDRLRDAATADPEVATLQEQDA